MGLQVGRLRTCGLALESVIGTVITTPTDFFRFIPPDSFFVKSEPLISKAIGTLPDAAIKQTPGPSSLDGMKLKLEVEPENIGRILYGCFGADTLAEYATFTISSSNNKINFKEDGGAERTATLTNGTYAMGTSSAQAGTMCALVKAQLQAAPSATGTYTVTYSYSTKKMTIAVGGAIAAVQILWLTGANNANGAYAVLGWTKADTSSAASVTSNSTTTTPVFTHTFVRQAVAQLPTFSFWFDKANVYPLFAGCMLGKLDLEAKAKELLTADTEWSGLSYSEGITQSPSYSTVRPFPFQTLGISVDSGSVLGYDNFKISINNMVKADHALSGSQYATKIYSEGMMVEISADLFFEDTVQYEKFINGTTASFVLTFTHIDDVSGAASGVKYALTLTIPQVVYKSANLVIPTGVLKVPFTGVAMYDNSSTYTMNAVLRNSVATAYSA